MTGDGNDCSHRVSGLTPCWCTPTKLCSSPVDHRFEETRWESFEADLLVGIVRRDLDQVVPSVWVNLNGVIPASRLIHDLPARTHIRFHTPQAYQSRRKSQAAGDSKFAKSARSATGRRDKSAACESRRDRHGAPAPEHLCPGGETISCLGCGSSFGVLVPLVV